MSKPYQVRAVQLDLARQMETIDYIKEFIDFSSANGYNSLFLYLEGRVKTASFSLAPDAESYSPEEMKEVVAYAASKGMDVIPGLACLGHAELFLKYDEMIGMAEIQDGCKGRFGGLDKWVFCPTKKQTQQFMEAYLTEICDIFPTDYIHIGLDEAWDFGFCEDCASIAKEFSGEQKLFLDHVKFCHRIISGKLKRRVMMWDDMFEYYPDTLSEVPRDVIMVCWQYQTDVRGVKGHFLNLVHRDILSDYDKLGFDYVIAPSDYSSCNVRTFTEYAESFSPLGGLVTSWEKKQAYIYRSYPTMAYAGRLWSNDSDKDEATVFAETIQALFGSDDDFLVQTMRTYTENPLLLERQGGINELLALGESGLNYSGYENLELLRKCLDECSEKVDSELGRTVLNDICLAAQYHSLIKKLKKWVLTNIAAENNQNLSIEAFKTEMSTLKKERVAQWSQYRTGLEPCGYEEMFDKNNEFLTELIDIITGHGVLTVRFCLPDKYSAEQCRVSLKYGDEWTQVSQGLYKGDVKGDAIYSYSFPIDKNNIPSAVRFEGWGCGGQGIAYVEACNAKGQFVPDCLMIAEGDIVDPESVLDNDAKWAFIGEKDSTKSYRDRKVFNQIHKLEYSLKKV